MKKYYLLIAAALMATAMSGCKKDEPKDPGDDPKPVAAELTVDETPIVLDCLGDTFNINVESNVENTAKVNYKEGGDGWIKLSTDKLSGNGSYVVTVGTYDSPLAARVAEIVITAGDKTATVSITQNPQESVSLPRSTVVAINDERTYSVDVISNANWKATTSDDWITILKGEGAAGTNKLQIKVAATEITTTTDADNQIVINGKRDGTVIITAGSTGAILKVSQGYGKLINGLIWADYNVDDPGTFVSNPEKIGKVYCYDNKSAFSIVGFNDRANPDMAHLFDCPAGYPVNTAYEGEDTWAKENDPCPDGWRIPTSDEIWALIGGEGSEEAANGDWYYNWYYWNQGVYCGSAEASTATCWDTKGCIFIPFCGLRNWEDGVQPECDRVWIQSITRPGQNWQRVCFVFNWTEAMAAANCENNVAMSIRPVADLIEE